MKPVDMLGFGPKREAIKLDNGLWQLTITPPESSGFSPSQITLTAGQYRRYQIWQDGYELIQDALFDLSASQREILITGIGPEEFAKFADDEEE